MQALRGEFGVSLPTAFRGVQELAREGLVESNPNPKGTIVIRSRSQKTARRTTIACLLRPPKPRNPDDNFALDMLESIQEAISRRGYRFIHHGLVETDCELRMVELAEEGLVSGILVDQKTPESTIRRLAACDLPVVLVNRHVRAPGLTCVTPDYEWIGRDALRKLVERKYERVGFNWTLFEEAQGPLTEARAAAMAPLLEMRRGFLDAARALGLPEDDIVQISELRSPQDVREPESYGLPRRRGSDWRRLAIFCANDSAAVHLMEAAAKTDLKMPDDIGVVACFDLPRTHHVPLPPSTYYVDPVEIGRRAVEVLLARIEGQNGETGMVRTTAQFIDRETA